MSKLLKRLLAFQQWPLFTKSYAAILLIGWGTLLFMTFMDARSLYVRLGDQIRENFAALSTQQMSKIVDVLVHHIALVRTVALNATVIEEAAASSERYSGDPVAELAALNQTWQNAAVDDPVVQDVINPDKNALTAQLLGYMKGFPDYDSLLVTDRYGGVIAATYRPTDYACTDQPWWQAAYGEGTGHLSVAVLDEVTGMKVSVALPILGEDSATVMGVVRATFHFESIKDLLDELFASYHVGAALFDANRTMLVASLPPTTGAYVNSDWLTSEAYNRRRSWQELSFENGEPALVGYSFIKKLTAASRDVVDEALYELDWSLLVYAPRSDVYLPLIRALWGVYLRAAVWGVGLMVAGFFLVRFFSGPLLQLLGVVAQEATGDRNVRAWIYAADEVGKLAQHINRLIEEKQALQQGVEQRSIERELEQKRRQRELETTAAIGAVTSATLELNALIAQAVEIVHDSFGLYFVGVFLLNETRSWAVLHGGTGEAGQLLLSRGYRARVDIGSIGQCITEGRAVVDRDVSASVATGLPELPYTRSELALPLRSRGDVWGALSVHSYHQDTFDGDLAVVLQIIADQIAVAIDSIRLFDARQEAMRSLQRAYGEASREAWESLLKTRDSLGGGYQAKRAGSVKLTPTSPESWRPDVQNAWQEECMVQSDDAASQEHRMALPVVVRGVVIGVIDVAKPFAAGAWTPVEIAELETLTYEIGVALENARLYEDARSRAVRQRLLSDVSSRIRSPLTIDAVLQTAAREMRDLLGLDEAEVRLAEQFDARTGTGPLADTATHQHK